MHTVSVIQSGRGDMKQIKNTILIIDDDPDMRHVLEAVLSKNDYHIEFAVNGLEGLEKVEKLVPDLILLDVMMPGMDGFEVCRRLKSSKKYLKIPIIMVTALDTREDMVQGLEAGADDFIHKPFNNIELRARVRSMLRISNLISELERSINRERYLADLGRLAGSIAHDLRNINFVILGSVEFLSHIYETGSEEDKICQRVLQVTSTMDNIVSGLMNYAKGGESVRIPRNIQPLIQAALDIFERQLQSVELLQDFAMVPPVKCSAGELQQVFLNLIKNAVDAMKKERTRQLFIRLWPEADEVRISVSDTGCGIPPDILPRIFDDLFTTKKDGTGIGLATVRKIVAAHDGKIDVTSEVGHGTTFTLSFPQAGPVLPPEPDDF